MTDTNHEGWECNADHIHDSAMAARECDAAAALLADDGMDPADVPLEVWHAAIIEVRQTRFDVVRYEWADVAHLRLVSIELMAQGLEQPAARTKQLAISLSNRDQLVTYRLARTGTV